METNYTTLIERYFDQLLSPEEVKEVERLKENDPDFLKEFELFEKSHLAVKLSTIIQLKSEIKEIHKKMDVSPKRGKVFQLRYFSIAASIAVLLGLGILFYAQEFSNENLHEEAYIPVQDYITNLDENLSEMEKAMKLLEAKEFNKASDSFNSIFNSTGKEAALFYAGHAYYQSGELDQAINSWIKISGQYRPEAQWYLALAYLKKGDMIEANKTLDSIIDVNEDEVFTQKAKELKRKLQSPFRKLCFGC